MNEIRMRYLLSALLLAPLLMPVDAFAAADGAVCLLEPSSIVSRSPSGIDQVSNVGDIQVRCSVPARPVSLKPGESLMALGAKTASAFLLLPNGSMKEVPAEVKGAGGGDDQTHAWVEFYLHLPLDDAQRDAEFRRALARLNREVAKDKSRPHEKLTEKPFAQEEVLAAELVFQHRVGRFHVECHLTQGDRSLGTAEVNFEVLFKGRFSDMWPFAAKP